MKSSKKIENYTESLKEYQDKMYLPGYYTGGKIHPVLKAKTKLGGYIMLFVGIFLLCFFSFQLFSNFSFENIGWIMPIIISVLLILVGIKFIKANFLK